MHNNISANIPSYFKIVEVITNKNKKIILLRIIFS